jgi:hypothetical protein
MEEGIAVIIGRRHVRVTEPGESIHPRLEGDDRVDGDLDIDHRLGRHARNACGSDMVDTTRQCAERRQQPSTLGLEVLRPIGVVGNERYHEAIR